MKTRIYIFLFILLTVSFSGFSRNVNAQVNFGFNSGYKYLKGSEASTLPSNWYLPGFDDRAWSSGTAPFRYGDGSGGTLLDDMMNSYSTVYMRSTFNASYVSKLSVLNVSLDFDDGFNLFINGNKVISENAPDNPEYNSFSTALRESGVINNYSLQNVSSIIHEGVNTIAVQGFNTSLESSDFYFDMSIAAVAEVDRISAEPVYSMAAGFYSTPFTLTISSPDPAYSVFYTLDGSNPQDSPSRIAGGNSVNVLIDPQSVSHRPLTPAVVVRSCLSSADFLPSFPKGSTYIFTTEVPQQNNPGGGWPATKNVNGQVIDLAVDSKVVNDSRYKNQIDYSLKSIPSISITTDIKNLFDPTTGIYVNAEGHGEEWERECSVELLNPDGSPGFNVNAGLRIRGGWSRHDDFPKHSLRLFFNSQYGNSKLEFPLFDDEGASKYDKIDLRTAQNYGWSNNQGEHNTMCREVFSRDTQRDMGQPYSRSRYYHLYLNGMYWGLYQTQERTEANFASTYLGGQDTDYDVAKVNTEGYSYVIEATDGTLDSWRNIWNLTTAGYSSNAAFFRLEGKDSFGEKVDGNPVLVDIDNLIDYMLVIFYTGNFDSPTSSFGGNKGCNNFFAIYNKTTKDQGFTFYAHDSEHSLMSDVIPPGTGLTEDRVNLARRTDGSNMDVNRFEVFHPQWLHEKLTVNEEYRLRFADRAYNYLRPGNVLSPEACTERFNTRAAQIEDAIIAESARWGDAKTGSWAYTKDDNWLPEINKVRTAFFPYRSNILVGQLELAGILPSVDPPDIISNGTTVYAENTSFTSSALVSFQNPNGKGAVYYTLDNTDPRLVGGGISPSAILWQAGNNVNMNYSARVNCRIYSNGEWSAMNFTTFLKTDEDYSALKVTELAYHPEDVINGTDTVFGTSLEYIEFKNTGDKPLNISGMMLDSAVHCTFPANTVLGPQQYYVAASKPGAFTEFFGYPPSANFSGNFSNSGEYVLLTDPFGNPVISFTYSDKSPWPVEADGSGYTLNSTLNNPVGDPNIYTYWRASHYKRGTPFSYDEYPNSIENKLNDEFELSLYPNPASEFVSIDIKSENQEEEFRIKIYSYAGVLLYDKVFENETTINLRENGIVPGMYLLKIENSRHTETRKLIVN